MGTNLQSCIDMGSGRLLSVLGLGDVLATIVLAVGRQFLIRHSPQ